VDEARATDEIGYPLRDEAEDLTPPGPPVLPVAPDFPPRRRIPPFSPWPLLLVVLLLVAGLGTAYAVTRSGKSTHALETPAAAAASPAPARSARTPSTSPSTVPQHPAPPPSAMPAKSSVATVAVPAVAGSSLPRAVAALKRAGLTVVVTHVAATVSEGRVVSQSPAAGAKVEKGGRVRLRVAVHPLVAVPDLTGMTGLRAAHTLQADHLKPSFKYVPSTQPARTVVSQWPRAGTKVRQGTGVLLNVSNGARPAASASGAAGGSAQVAVPDVTGEDEATATAELQDAGFSVDSVDSTTSDPSEDGVVLDETPSGGSRAADGSTVTITVGRYSGG